MCVSGCRLSKCCRWFEYTRGYGAPGLTRMAAVLPPVAEHQAPCLAVQKNTPWRGCGARQGASQTPPSLPQPSMPPACALAVLHLPPPDPPRRQRWRPMLWERQPLRERVLPPLPARGGMLGPPGWPSWEAARGGRRAGWRQKSWLPMQQSRLGRRGWKAPGPCLLCAGALWQGRPAGRRRHEACGAGSGAPLPAAGWAGWGSAGGAAW